MAHNEGVITMETINGLLNSFFNETSSLVKEVVNENKLLKRKINVLQNKIDKLENHSKRKDIVIYGVPPQDGENPKDLAVELCEKVGVAVNINDIEAAYRRHSKNDESSSPFLIKLTSSLTKEEIMQKAREKHLTADALGGSSEERILFDDHVTKRNFTIFVRAYESLGDHYFLWKKNGTVLAMKKEGTDNVVFKIKSVEQIAGLKVSLSKKGNTSDVTTAEGVHPETSADANSKRQKSVQFSEEDISKLSPNLLLYRAAAAHNLPVMCHAFSIDADPNWVNLEDKNRVALHQAVISGSVMACEYLLLNGAKLNVQDSEGKTPLYFATTLGHTAQVCLLLKHKADQHLTDNDGIDPLTIAVAEANADIVTLLRLAKLNEEMRDTEFGENDELVDDVFRDFVHLTFNSSTQK